MEVDISDKVNKIIKFGLPGLMGITAIFVSLVWWYENSHCYLTIHDAQVRGTLVNVTSKTNGTITEFVVKNGDAVKSGDPLAKVKVSITPEQIKELEKTVEIARKNLSKVQEGVTVTQPVYSGGGTSIQAEEAAAHLEKMEKLYAMGAVSAAQRDEAAAAYEIASMGGGGTVSYQTIVQPSSPQIIQNAELQVKFAEASLAKAQQESNATIITAPVPGTVYYNTVKLNDEIQPGQVIFNIGSIKNIWVEAYLKPENIDKVSVGQFVSYKINGNKLTGTVLEIKEPVNLTDDKTAISPEDIKTAGKYVVKISLIPPNDMIISPGNKVSVDISLN